MWNSFLSTTGLSLFVLFVFFSGIQGDCGPPPKLNNAFPLTETDQKRFPLLSSVTYQCLDGFFNIHGKLDVTTCISDSQWSTIDEFCEPRCSRPPKFKFAKIKPGDRRHYYSAATQVNYICNPGYVSIPGISSSITCLENYTWTALPVFCEGKSCGDPGKPENGEAVVLTNLLFKAKVNFTCEEGYKLIGSPSTECILKGDEVEWKTKPPQCQSITALSTSMTFPERQTRETTMGDCPAPPNPPHATLRSGELQISYPAGTILRYSCIPGYQFIVGTKPTLQCLENSKWTETPTFCERKRCPVPVIENGDMQTTDDLRLGETVTFVCNKGYRMLGPNTARCTLFEGSKVDWNRQPPSCERIPCARPPRIANGRHDGDEGLDHYDYGTVVTYTCEKDFTLIGTASISCTSDDGQNGHWDRPAPECKVVVCQRPEIANGMLTSPFQSTYKYDHVLRFVCNAGHTLVGSEFVKCGADNSWHPALPSCIRGIFTTATTTTTTTGAAPVPPGGDEVPGSNAVAIGIGVVVGVIVVAGIIFVFMKYRARHQTGKSDIRSGPSDSYREVSRNDVAMEMK